MMRNSASLEALSLVLVLLGVPMGFAQSPPETPILTIDSDSISWTAVTGASGYDLIRGDLRALRASGGDFTTATRVCLVDDSPAQAFAYEGAPKPGEGFWFLVRATSGAEAGTYDSGGAGQVGARDAEIEAAPSACFSPVVAHAPITIDGDAGFTAANGVVGGSGTTADPYLIAGWDIACFPPEYLAIAVLDTTLPFVVRNVRARACDYGIGMVSVRDCRVHRMRASDVNYGVYLDAGQDCAIEGNHVSFQGGPGVVVGNSTNVLVKGNQLEGGMVGISLADTTSGSAVLDNDLIANVLQAVDESGGLNAWDGGYPDGGNYWSNYQGVDQCGGPAQDDCSAGDGLGDTPYFLNAVTADRYPRMIPAFAEGDMVPPVVAITSPAAGAVFATAPIAVSGTAADSESGLRRAEVRVNGGPWTIPNGASSWNHSVWLVFGSNTLEARSLDHAGNVSAIASITVTFAPILEVAVQTDKPAYVPGEAVAITIRVTNHDSQPVTLHFSSTCQANFRVESDVGAPVFGNPQTCFFVNTQRTWQPGETVIYSFTWRQVDDNGQQVPVPGDYRIIGSMLSTEAVPEGQTAIPIAP